VNNFLTLEGGYLVIAAFVLVVTLYVTTRPFMSKNAFKAIFPAIFAFLIFAIGAHYYITTERMKTVQAAFEEGKVIICENKGSKKMGRTVLVEKDTEKWYIENDMFVSELYSRGFHTARCVVHIVQKNKD
jgi:hypothetical protein